MTFSQFPIFGKHPLNSIPSRLREFFTLSDIHDETIHPKLFFVISEWSGAEGNRFINRKNPQTPEWDSEFTARHVKGGVSQICKLITKLNRWFFVNPGGVVQRWTTAYDQFVLPNAATGVAIRSNWTQVNLPWIDHGATEIFYEIEYSSQWFVTDWVLLVPTCTQTTI